MQFSSILASILPTCVRRAILCALLALVLQFLNLWCDLDPRGLHVNWWQDCTNILMVSTVRVAIAVMVEAILERIMGCTGLTATMGATETAA